jgi:hypothetical protein
MSGELSREERNALWGYDIGAHTKQLKKDRETRKKKEAEEDDEIKRFLEKKKAQNAKNAKNATKLPTEKRHKSDYKQVKGNIQKSRSDLRVNPKTDKREITTNMTINKGLTTKEKAGLKNFIIDAIDNNSKNNIIKDDCTFEIELYYNELNDIIIKDVYIKDGVSKKVYDGIKESISLLLDE